MIEREIWGRIVRDFWEWDVELIRRDVRYEIPKVQRALVVIGPRRAGKTYFMFQIIKDLLNRIDKRKIIFVNFEDPRLIDADLNDLMSFLDVFYTIYPENVKETCYFFLDEVQCVKNWERFVRFLLDKNQKVILSGSSSKLLSREIATHLRGRSISIKIYPFSFREILKANGIEVGPYLSSYELAKVKNLAESYLMWGGYPEVVLNPSLRREILKEILDLTIYRDIVERWRVENIRALRLIIKMLAYSTHLSISKIYRNLKGLGLNIGKNTIANYIEYLEDSLIVYRLQALVKSYKKAEILGFKPYLVDNGILHVLGVEDRGRLLENLVFVELLKKGYVPNEDIFYYTFEGGEVDFVVDRQLIQVCYDVNDYDTRTREVRALVKASKNLNYKDCLIITWDQEETIVVNGLVIKVVPIWKWCLGLYSTPKPA